MVKYMDIAPGQGQISEIIPGGEFFININILSICPFLASFALQITFNNFPHSNALATYVDLALK